MNTTSKLALLCALALAAMAVASASALATTVTPEGGYTATEDGDGNLNNGVLNITCTGSTAAGSVSNTNTPSRMTITNLAFNSCSTPAGDCGVTLTTLPAQLDVRDNTAAAPPDSTATLVASESAIIQCGGGSITCVASADTSLQLEGTNSGVGVQATLRVVAQEVAVSGTASVCGTLPGEWNSQWTILTSGGGDTTLVVEA
jgi:hypothetical protein